MQLSHLLTAAATQALAINALAVHPSVLPRQTNLTDAHLANFRTWGAADCPGGVDNEGEWNEQLFDLNICYQFPNNLEVVSIRLQNIDTGAGVTCNGTSLLLCFCMLFFFISLLLKKSRILN